MCLPTIVRLQTFCNNISLIETKKVYGSHEFLWLMLKKLIKNGPKAIIKKNCSQSWHCGHTKQRMWVITRFIFWCLESDPKLTRFYYSAWGVESRVEDWKSYKLGVQLVLILAVCVESEATELNKTNRRHHEDYLSITFFWPCG